MGFSPVHLQPGRGRASGLEGAGCHLLPSPSPLPSPALSPCLSFRFQTQSSGRHSLRITGISNINFQASFSTQLDFGANQPGERPVQGEAGAGLGAWVLCLGFLQLGTWLGCFLPSSPPGLPISVVVNCTGLKPPGHLQEIELFNTSGHALLSLPARPLSNTSSGQLWVGSLLRVPPGDFLLKVKGEDTQGHPLHRLSGVTYTSVVPGELSPQSPRVLRRDQRLQHRFCFGFCWGILFYFLIPLPSAALGELPKSVICVCVPKYFQVYPK